MTRKLVLFDIDGTILLTAGAGRRAILAALTEEVGPVPEIVPHCVIVGQVTGDEAILVEAVGVEMLVIA